MAAEAKLDCARMEIREGVPVLMISVSGVFPLQRTRSMS